MKRLAAQFFTCLLLSLLVFTSDALAQKKKACAPSLAKCPDQGCGKKFDALLNRAKNRKTSPASSSVVDMKLEEIKSMDQPDTWEENKSRAELKKDGKREGQAVRVTAFLWKAKREHGESCNCGLDAKGVPGELLTDIHMVLAEHADDPEAISVTAEITPRVRMRHKQPVTWAASRIRALEGKFIRVTGYLMLDTEHLIHNPLVRATNWEVHPITKLEVCTLTPEECKGGKGWKNVP
jgi:hypothetical protein